MSPRAFEVSYDKNNLYDMIRLLKEMGIHVARIDWGYSVEEIAYLSNNQDGVIIELNASSKVIDNDYCNKLIEYSANIEKLRACHNFYPKASSGLKREAVSSKNRLFHQYGIQTGGFIASRYHHRKIVGDGLPTVEEHRYINPIIAAKEMYLMGNDNIYFGDDFASPDEVCALGSFEREPLVLSFAPLPGNDDVMEWINRKEAFHVIWDNNTTKIRCRERYPNEVAPFNNICMNYGNISIDNQNYKRYAGEVNISTGDHPADSRTNIIGKVIEDERLLIKYLTEEVPFRLRALKYTKQ
jgi:uncharacterized protein